MARLQGAGCGLVEGTLVATDHGWVPIETVEAGERILTFDGGMQQCVAMIRDQIWSGPSCPDELWPLRVKRDTIGNRHDMLVMPAQGVLIESDTVTDAFGDPFAVIPGAALEVLQGVTRQEPRASVELFMPVFGEDQMVFADNGALLFCQTHWGLAAGILPRYGVAGNYNMLPLDLAKRVLAKGDFGEILDYSVAVF
ncbi:Hint domain-containing protein [Shimia biformata]|uniref:Hint domain-containing protein n=1 Tax=Shimia biformata TaxID=1294299 RepID=UPI00195004F3|nr:Hint domain-containing protein [Shimia biformata]